MKVTAAAKEVSLTKLIKAFAIGGIATLIACGSITYSNVWSFDSPNACAASHWPFSTDNIAALIVSEPYAPTLKVNPIIAVTKAFSVMPMLGSP